MKDSSQLCATYILSLAFLPFDRGTRPSDRGIYLPEAVTFLYKDLQLRTASPLCSRIAFRCTYGLL
nr:hypothetical protein Q903MT_gene5953 [Picea sitchensis]